MKEKMVFAFILTAAVLCSCGSKVSSGELKTPEPITEAVSDSTEISGEEISTHVYTGIVEITPGAETETVSKPVPKEIHRETDGEDGEVHRMTAYIFDTGRNLLSITITVYDRYGNIKSTEEYDISGELEEEIDTEYEYNASGKIRSVTVGSEKMLHVYDGDGNISHTVFYDGGQQTKEEFYEYDEYGNLTQKKYITANKAPKVSETYENEYNGSGLIISKKKYVPEHEEPETVSSYTYDENGKLTEEQETYPLSEDGNYGYIRRYSYDSSGNVTREEYFQLSDAYTVSVSETMVYSYNEKGRISSIETYRGGVLVSRTEYEYEEYGQLTDYNIS